MDGHAYLFTATHVSHFLICSRIPKGRYISGALRKTPSATVIR